MNMHLTKNLTNVLISAENSSNFPSTCSHNAFNVNHVFHKNYENSYFYHNSTVDRVTASTPQHCMDTKEKVLHSTCLFASPYFPSIPVTVFP